MGRSGSKVQRSEGKFPSDSLGTRELVVQRSKDVEWNSLGTGVTRRNCLGRKGQPMAQGKSSAHMSRADISVLPFAGTSSRLAIADNDDDALHTFPCTLITKHVRSISPAGNRLLV